MMSRRFGMVYTLSIMASCLTTLVGLRIMFSLFALSLGASAFQVGLLAATYQFFSLVVAIPAGMLGDRYGARWPLVGSAVLGVLGLLVPYFLPSVPMLFLGMALCGIWAVVNLILTQSLIGAFSTKETLAQAFSNFSLVSSCSFLVGGPLAGFAIDAVGHELGFLVLVPLASFSLMLALFGRGLPGAKRKQVARGDLRSLLTDRRLWWVLLLGGSVQLAGDMFPFFVPIYGHSVGLSASFVGIVVGAAYGASFAVRIWLQALITRLGEEPLLAWSLAVAGGAMAIVPLFSSPAALVAVALVFGAGIAVGHPLTSMLMYRNSPPGREGEVMGLRATGNGLLRVSAPPAMGGLAALAGLPVVFVTTAVILGSVALFIGSRQKHRARAEGVAD